MKIALAASALCMISVTLAAPMTGTTATQVKSAISTLGGRIVACSDPALNAPQFLATCAKAPLTAATFQKRWAALVAKTFPGSTLIRDWKMDDDPAYKGAFSRVYKVNSGSLLVYYQPSGNSGLLSFVFDPPKGATAQKFRSCAEARAAGFSNMQRGQPGYSASLDRDNDGVACDK